MERKGERCCELFVRLGHQGQGVRMAPVTRGALGLCLKCGTPDKGWLWGANREPLWDVRVSRQRSARGRPRFPIRFDSTRGEKLTA